MGVWTLGRVTGDDRVIEIKSKGNPFRAEKYFGGGFRGDMDSFQGCSGGLGFRVLWVTGVILGGPRSTWVVGRDVVSGSMVGWET